MAGPMADPNEAPFPCRRFLLERRWILQEGLADDEVPDRAQLEEAVDPRTLRREFDLLPSFDFDLPAGQPVA